MADRHPRLCRRVTPAQVTLPAMRLQVQVANREVYGCGGVLNPRGLNRDAVRSWR